MKRIAFLTDTHLDEEPEEGHIIDTYRNLKVALDDVSRRGVDEIIFGGDIGEDSSHLTFFRIFNPYSFKLVLGNHDTFNQVRKFYPIGGRELELYYATEDELHKSIFLDSSVGAISNMQMKWLYDQLRTVKRILLFIHHPILKVHTAIDAVAPLKNRAEVRRLLTASNKEISIFCGHYHVSDAAQYKNLRQFTTSALSFQLARNPDHVVVDSSNFGYRLITINRLEILTQTIQFDSPR